MASARPIDSIAKSVTGALNLRIIVLNCCIPKSESNLVFFFISGRHNELEARLFMKAILCEFVNLMYLNESAFLYVAPERAPFVATFPLQFAHMHAQTNHLTAVAPQCDVRWRTTTAHTAHQYCAPTALANLLFTTPKNTIIFVTAVVLGATSPHPSPPLHHPAAHGTTLHRCCKCRRIAKKNHKFRQISQTFSKYNTTLYYHNRPQNPSHIFWSFCRRSAHRLPHTQTPADLTPARLSNAAAGFSRQVSI